MIQEPWSPAQKSSTFICWHLDDSGTDGPETTLGNTVLRKVASRSPESPGSLDGAWTQGKRGAQHPSDGTAISKSPPQKKEVSGPIESEHTWRQNVFPKGEVPRNEIDVGKWECHSAVAPRTGLPVADVTHGTRPAGLPVSRPSCTQRGNCCSPSKRTLDVSNSGHSPFFMRCFLPSFPEPSDWHTEEPRG